MNKNILSAFALSTLFFSACGTTGAPENSETPAGYTTPGIEAANNGGNINDAAATTSTTTVASATATTAASATARTPATAANTAPASVTATITEGVAPSSVGNAGTNVGTAVVNEAVAQTGATTPAPVSSSATAAGTASSTAASDGSSSAPLYAFFRYTTLQLAVEGPARYINPLLVVFTENPNFCEDLSVNSVKADSADILFTIDDVQPNGTLEKTGVLSKYTHTKYAWGNPGDFACGMNKKSAGEEVLDPTATIKFGSLDKNFSLAISEVSSKTADAKLVARLPKQATVCGALFSTWPVVNARGDSNNGSLKCVE